MFSDGLDDLCAIRKIHSVALSQHKGVFEIQQHDFAIAVVVSRGLLHKFPNPINQFVENLTTALHSWPAG